ncbi:MAG TPA: alpha/beta fold hydrolase [Nevskiales bacterium]|nr:alpha/beta fold hydrolase [Nevskiales bacterium]
MKNADHRVVFAHGMESAPWGTKITALAAVARAKGFEPESPDFRHTMDFDERVRHLLALNPRCNGKLVLAGSSMGGYVVAHACAQLKPAGLFLMAPALYFEGYDAEPQHCPELTCIVHGWKDDVVPVERALRFARGRRADLHLLDSGHTLNDRIPTLEKIFADFLDRVLAA